MTSSSQMAPHPDQWSNRRIAELEVEVLALKKRLVQEMCISRTRTEMLEEFGDDYERYL